MTDLIRWVYRGSGWFLDARYCRAAYRGLYGPGHRTLALGLRCTRGKR
jgi:formylglycine-generating enzyme required for sulfatase activity